MPRDITVTLQDGSTHVYKGAPDDVTPEAVSARAEKELGQPVVHLDGGKAAVPQESAPAPRWDIGGDIGRAFDASVGALKQDWQNATTVPTKQEMRKPTLLNPSGYDQTGKLLSAAKLPLDALGAITAPITGAIHGIGGSALSYVVPTPSKDMDVAGHHYFSDPKKAADQIIDNSMLALGPRGMGTGDALVTASEDAAAANAARKAATLKNRAIAKVNERATADGLTPQQVQDAQQAASAGGDKVTLMDLGDKNVRGLAGAVYRAPGPAGKEMDTFLKSRDAAATGDLTKDVQSSVANGSTYSAVQDLIKQRSAAAGPAYKEALSADSTAPFEDQFRTALTKATGAKGQIAKRISDIEQNNPGALAARGAAGKSVRDEYMGLQEQLQKAEADRQSAMDVFKRAQEDRTANAPGATWSPRLQEFLNHPAVKRGLQEGLMQEQQDAISEGRPFKPADYSIVGQDEAGKPIVGAVPTMKSLAVAKEGLDGIVAGMRDPMTGRPTKAGVSLGKFRDAFRNELDNINPQYKTARQAWSGPTQSMEAVIDGRQHFTRSESNEQLKAEFDALSPGDKDFYRMGAAEAKVDQLERAPDASDKSKRVINSERDRKRFSMLFDSPAQAQQFIDSVARKRQAFETQQAVKGNSPTAGRIAEDADHAGGTMFKAAGGLMSAAGGNLFHAAKAAYEVKRDLGLRNNPEFNSEIAKLLMDHNIPVGDMSQGLVPPVPVPAKKNSVASAAIVQALLRPPKSSPQAKH